MNKTDNQPPKLARRKENRRSSLKSGRTIPGHREKLEKASERAAAHEKIRKKQILRLTLAILGLLLIVAAIIGLGLVLSGRETEPQGPDDSSAAVVYKPTIEIIDEDAISGSTITDRMKDYIGQAEVDFRALGIVPIKAVVPKGAIREIDFYLEGKTGFIKAIIDRGTGVTAEDAKRMLNYLETQGITDFEYIDVRIDGKAYWK